MMMNMGEVFRRTAEQHPNATALVDSAGGVEYTYREWYDRSVELAAALEEHGIGEGDFVATAMRNRAELSTLYCATQLHGAVLVPYKFRLSADELLYLIDNTKPELFFFSDEVYGILDPVIERSQVDFDLVSVDDAFPDAVTYDEFVAKGSPERFAPSFVSPEEVSVVLHTSGTTGKPKGVPRTHVNTYSGGVAHAIQNDWQLRESTLGMITLSHPMGIHSLAAVLLLGGKWVIQRTFQAEELLDLIESERISSLYLVPTVYHDLFESDAVETADFSSVTHISYASSQMTPSTIKAIEEYIAPESFVNHYGSTEVYTHAVCDRPSEKLNCFNQTGVNSVVRIAALNDRPDPSDLVETGEVGEIIVDASSPEAFDAYLSAEDERSIVDGWFFTGDLGYRDADGNLFLVGRVDDMIISGGENIYPVEVERVLETHEIVDEAAVVGRTSDRWNQVVSAFVTVTVEPSEIDFGTVADALDNHCHRSNELANFKRPRKYFFIDEMTKSYVGKILRKELQKREPDVDIYAEIVV